MLTFHHYACEHCDYECQPSSKRLEKMMVRLHNKRCKKTGRTKQPDCFKDTANKMRANTGSGAGMTRHAKVRPIGDPHAMSVGSTDIQNLLTQLDKTKSPETKDSNGMENVITLEDRALGFVKELNTGDPK
jgi:hypothetical protein